MNAGRAEVRKVIERARHRLQTSGERTIFFLDEIHRFNKAQQDTLLPAVEDGTVVLVGATTENPYFEVNSALLSRCPMYELRSLDEEHVLALLRRALGAQHGIPDAPRVDDDALEFLAARSAGDARTALSALELAAETVGESGAVTLRVAEDALQRSAILYDKGGDLHYDLISAWIKATRGSDPDASLLYLAAMLEGGEDPRFIARRMVPLSADCRRTVPVDLIVTIENELKQARLAREDDRRDALTLILSSLRSAEKELQRPLSEDEELQVLQRERKKRVEAFEAFEAAGREEQADKEDFELEVLEEVMPDPLSEDELDEIVDDVIAEVGATSLRDIGRVMADVMPRVSGKADGSAVSRIVREKLA